MGHPQESVPEAAPIHLGEEGVWRHWQLELLEPQWGQGTQREAGNHGMRELAPARALPSALGGRAGAGGERLQMAPPLSHHSTMTPLFSVSFTSIPGYGFPHSGPLRLSPCN